MRGEERRGEERRGDETDERALLLLSSGENQSPVISQTVPRSHISFSDVCVCVCVRVFVCVACCICLKGRLYCSEQRIPAVL